MQLAFLFPGQGAQHVGMGRALAESYALARQTFDQADDVLGFALSRLCFEGPEAELRLTANAQPALLTTSVAMARVLEQEGIVPDFVAGHSLGEYSALVVAGGLELEPALRTVRRRGEYMQEAVPVGLGGMAAIVGGDLAAVEVACHEAAQGEVVTVANLNCPGQVVISGHLPAVERAVAIVEERRLGKGVMLPVSAPFHCPLMEEAGRRLASDLNALDFHDLCCPLVTNTGAQPVQRGADARQALLRQMVLPVAWEASMRCLLSEGVHLFVEIGLKGPLKGMMKKIDRQAQMLVVDGPASVTSLRETLRGYGRAQ